MATSDLIIEKRGRTARERAMNRAGSSRITDSAWYPEIEWMTDLQMTNPEIAKATRLSVRRIQQIRQNGRADGSALVKTIPIAKPREELDPELLSTLEFTAEGFERFFVKFSGLDYLPEHAFEWVAEFIQSRNLMINVPPRHAKSKIMSVWLPIWLLCMDRNEQIICVSQTSQLSRIMSSEVAYNLEFNEELINAFGRFAPERAKDSPWRPSRGEMVVLGRTGKTKIGQFSYLARGSGQQILGTEATVVIVDDVTNGETARSEKAREDEWVWLRESVLSRVEPSGKTNASGRALVVGQRVHLRDVYGRIEEQKFLRGPDKGKPLWKTIKYPAILRWPDEDPENPEPLTLWPQRWPFEELMESYERLGSATFECMYQQVPLPEDAAFVRPEWWLKCRDYERPGYRGIRIADGEEGYLPIVRVLSIDPSPTEYNALIVADVIATRDVFAMAIIEIKTWKGGSREFMAEVDRCIANYGLDYFILESSTMTKWFEGDPLYQTIKNRVTVLAHHTGRNKGDAELGMMSLAADVEAGRIRLPYGDMHGVSMSEQFEHQANVYGYGYEDDLLMAAWFIKWNYRKLILRRAFQGHFRSNKSSQAWGFTKRGAMSDEKRIKAFREARRKNG